MKLNNNEVFALSDYLRHQLAVEYPMEQYFIEKAATALEDLANERAELKAEISLLNTPIVSQKLSVGENDSNN
jgi:cell division protein FtsB